MKRVPETSPLSDVISLSLCLCFADLLLAGRFVDVPGIRKTAIPQH